MNSLLFLHGAGTSDKDRTKYLSDELKKYSVNGLSFNFSGYGGNPQELAKSSLEKRLSEAENAIKEFHLNEPLNLCGSSMGGYIAIKLLENHVVENLILFAPAVYDTKAFALPFDSTFSEVIRNENSWENSDAFGSLEKFTGNALIFMGEKDEVIPKRLFERIDKSLSNCKSKEIVKVPECPHKIHLWLSQNGVWKQRVGEKIGKLLK